MTFDRFDEVGVPDQWDDIAARAMGPGGPGFEPRGHRMAILVAVAAAVVGLAGILWVGLGDGDDLATVGTPADTVPESAPPATTAPVTTMPPTSPEAIHPPATTEPVVTVAETAPPATTAPPTTAPADPAFACTDMAGGPNAVYETDPALEQFGPLGAAPTLDITTGWPQLLGEGSNVTRVPDGTAILLQTQWPQRPGWSVSVVNDDGTLRWRRCGHDTEVLGMIPGEQFVVVTEQDPDAVSAPRPAMWRVLELTTGADAGMLDIPSDLMPIAGGQTRYWLFGKSQPFDTEGKPIPGTPDDMLLVLDAATMSTTEIPYPPDYYSGDRYATWLQMVESRDGPDGWMLEQFGDEYPIIASVFVDGAWTTDPTVIRSVIPVTAFSPYGQGGEWSGFDPLGTTMWTVSDRVAFWSEGPWHFEDGDIDMLVVCERYDVSADGGSVCVSPGLLGVDGESGTTLWELSGHRQVAAVGDGYAIITDGTDDLYDGTMPRNWLMIDTATGEPFEGQIWDYETFETNYYNMEEDGVWVRRDGGVVVAVNGEHVRIWMPAAFSTDTINVSLRE